MLYHRITKTACTLFGPALLAGAASAQWSTTNFSTPRVYAAAAAVDGKAIFAGGEDAVGALATVDVYDSVSRTWSSTALVQPRSVAAATSVNGLVLIAGGYDLPPAGLDSVEVYDSATGTLSMGAPLSSARFAARAATVGDKALFAGGFHLTTCTDAVDIYDATIGPPSLPAAWSTAALSAPRIVDAAAVGDYVLFAGGVCPDFATGQLNPSDVVDIYDSTNGSWSVHHLSQARGRMGVAVVGTKVLFAGGAITFPPPYSDVVDIYDSALGHPTNPAAWSTATLSEARWDLNGGASVGDKALFAGGQSATGMSDVVDIYDAATGAWSTAQLAVPRNATGVSVGDVALFAGGLVSAPPPVFSDLVDVFDPAIGTTYCSPGIANSTGLAGVISAQGATLAAGDDVRLIARQLPPGQFGYFLASQTQGMFAPAASQGVLCLAGDIGRFAAPSEIIQGPEGSIRLDLSGMPVNPSQAVLPGDTWNFQCWHRDDNPGPTSNFTDAVTITFD